MTDVEPVQITVSPNMGLEDIFDEISKHGILTCHQYLDTAHHRRRLEGKIDKLTPDKGGAWTCEIQPPYNPASYELHPIRGQAGPGTAEYCHRFQESPRIAGRGPTARAAAEQCLRRLWLYVEHGWHCGWEPREAPPHLRALAFELDPYNRREHARNAKSSPGRSQGSPVPQQPRRAVRRGGLGEGQSSASA